MKLEDEPRSRHGKENISDAYANLRAKTRVLIRSVWKMRRAGAYLTTGEEQLAAILEQHPEYHKVWDADEEEPASGMRPGGVNPFLHITIHQVVENQIRDRNPPQVLETLNRLLENYQDRHEVIHRIGTVLATMLFQPASRRPRFDSARYIKDLEALS